MSKKNIVGMCGDGANDCAALSLAHFGVALSESEASLSSPFTAKTLSTMAVVELIKEGRACLANNMAAFKWSVLFGSIQTTLSFIAYFFGADMSQGEYIVQDLCTYFISVMAIVYTRPSTKLQGNPPTSKIFGPTTMASLLGPLTIFGISIGIAVHLLLAQSWFKPHTVGFVAYYYLPETTTVWLLSLFIYPACYISMAFGLSWRQPIYKNYALVGCVLLSLIYVIIFGSQPQTLAKFFEIMEVVYLPDTFRGYILLIGLISFVTIILWERLVVVGPVANFLRLKTGRGRVLPIGGIHDPTVVIWA